MKFWKLLCKLVILFLIGGFAYYTIELWWRGHSHGSMFVLGGVCFVFVGLINQVLPRNFGLLWQSLIGAAFITAAEFVTGLIVNVWLGLNIWDYSTLPLNILGQVSLPFSLVWIGLSCIAILLDDWIRYRFFGEKPPKYKLL